QQGVVSPKVEMKKLVDDFVRNCQRAGVKLLRERSGTPAHYLASYQRIFSNMEAAPKMKSYKKIIIPITFPNKASKPVQSLTDGIFASFESWQNTDRNWIYYTGQHMEFVLDLGEVTDIHHIHMDFLNPQAQPDWHLMALPKFVSYALSNDGKEYETSLVLNNPHEPNPKINKELKEVSIYSFAIDFLNAKKARFIKVHAESLLTTPSWHIRSGKPISIYCDQIMVS
ncbi:MAG: discoidin domain-containing protein, partial [Sphingobacteriales bacterium]